MFAAAGISDFGALLSLNPSNGAVRELLPEATGGQHP
jgi:hypothetical protein